jgi:hypothetical protein
VVEGLVAWFAERGVERVDLDATDDASGVYARLGFVHDPAGEASALTLRVRPPSP